MTPNINFSVVSKDSGPLTKIIKPDGQGGIIKDGKQCRMRIGTVESITIPFIEFGSFIRSLDTHQAIAHGVCEAGTARIVSSENYTGQPGTITRTKKFFCYPDGPGIGMFDHDPKPGQAPLSPVEFKEIIAKSCPLFKDVATIYTPSTSSCIYAEDGTELAGVSAGFHMYFPVKNASLLPAFADTLFKRLIISGYGYPFITSAGVVHVRTIFDASVFSPERLDFVSGAICEGGCYQRLPDPVYTEGEML